MTRTIYTTRATTRGGRVGRVATDDGRLSVALTRPPEMGGTEAHGTNPEQLLAAGFAACFRSALDAAAGAAGVEASVTCEVALNTREDRGYAFEVLLTVTFAATSPADGLDLVRRAEGLCPFSHTFRHNSHVEVHHLPAGAMLPAG